MDPISKARIGANTEASKAKRLANLRAPWKPGQSGNLSGRPRKQAFTKACEKVANSRKGQKLLVGTITDILDKRGMAAVLLMREMADRLEGKVADVVDMSVTGTVVLAQIIEERRKKRATDSRES